MVVVQPNIFYAPPADIPQTTKPLPPPTRHTTSVSLAKTSSTISTIHHTSTNEFTSPRSPTTAAQSSTKTQSSTSTQLINNSQLFINSQSSTGTSSSTTSLSTGPQLSLTDSQTSTNSSIFSINAQMSTSLASSSSVRVPSSTVTTSSQIFGASSLNSVNSIPSTSAISSPTGPLDPTQSLGTAGKSLGPIIGGIIGGITFVALSALTVVMIISRRRRRQKQWASLPTANPLLTNPHITKRAAQRDFLEKGSHPFYNLQNPSASGSSDQMQTHSQDQNQITLRRSNQGPALSPSPGDVESIMQRQMEMISSISQRMMVLEAHRLGDHTTATEPPDYEGHTPT